MSELLKEAFDDLPKAGSSSGFAGTTTPIIDPNAKLGLVITEPPIRGWTREQYLQFHTRSVQKMIEITKAKNADYTGGSDDPFFNFTRVEANSITSTEVGFLTRMSDKFARITTFVNKGVLKVASESIEDTLLDLANYCILMAGYIRSKRGMAP